MITMRELKQLLSYSSHVEQFSIGQFTVVCLVAWPLNESEARGDLVLIETSLLFLYEVLLMTASLTKEMQEGFYQNKINSSLTFIQRPGS